MTRKSIDKLREIAKLRRIKNRGKLKKDGLIISILKSESSSAERNCMKHFNTITNVSNNNINVSNINDVNNNTNDDFSDKEKEKIYDNLFELVNKLNKKEKYRYNDLDLDYHGMRCWKFGW